MAPGQTVEVGDLPPDLQEAASVAGGQQDWESGLARVVDAMLSSGEGPLHETLTHAFERVLISRALAHTGGRRIEAAVALGIGRNTITRKIHDLGLGNDSWDEPANAA